MTSKKILKQLSDSNGGMTKDQIAEVIKSHPSTVHKLLEHMRLDGVVKRKPIEREGVKTSYNYTITKYGLKRLVWYGENHKKQ